jgi:drug/metabolite transporter (DMT)-like permease
LAAGVVASGVAGNSLLRVGLGSSGVVTFSPIGYLREFANAAVIAGVGLLALGFILQLTLLSWADLTYALPVTSSSYVVITVVGVVGLHEHVSVAHWGGVLLILTGVIVVGRTKPLTTGKDRR